METTVVSPCRRRARRSRPSRRPAGTARERPERRRVRALCGVLAAVGHNGRIAPPERAERRVDDREGDIEDARERLRQQSLAGARWANQQDVRFRQFHLGAALLVHLDALVVVVNRDRELLLRAVLTDYVLVKIFLQFQWFGELMRRPVRLIVTIVFQDRVAYGDALVANVSSGVIVGGGD